MTKEQQQVLAECKQELAQNYGCSSEKVEEILAKHGLKLGLIDDPIDSVASQMFGLMCDRDKQMSTLMWERAKHTPPISLGNFLSLNDLWT